MALSVNTDMKPRPQTNAKPADESAASAHLSPESQGQPRSPGPCKAKLSCSHPLTQPDLFAGAGIVDAHTRHPCAFVAPRTGLTVETRHGIDAA